MSSSIKTAVPINNILPDIWYYEKIKGELSYVIDDSGTTC